MSRFEKSRRDKSFFENKYYVLLMLSLVMTMSLVDRNIIAILQQPIKDEFGLSDTAMGFLMGTAFALFYATLGIPFARLADRTNRVYLVSFAIACWSTMTALCGMAANFVQLALARIGVGVGEAAGSPPSPG